MPALQIRDLPDDLYEPLKERAAKNRRSLAQEATVALEAYMASRGRPDAGPSSGLRLVPDPSAGEPSHRRRAAAFERIHARGALALPPEFEDAAALVRAVREERDCQLAQGRGDVR